MSDEINNKKSDSIRLFQMNEETSEFEEIDIAPDQELHEFLDSDRLLFFINAAQYKSYLWTGKNVSIRTKFISAKKSGELRDQFGPAIKITTVDEDDETLAFKIMIGLEEEIDYEEEQTGPAYEGKAEDEVLLEELTLNKIVLLLEKIGCPEGYKREMVVEGKNVYGYQEIYIEYLDEIIKERKLYPLEDSVPDGSYLAKELTPRLIMSYNKVILVDMLRKMTPEEIQEQEDVEIKIRRTKQTQSPFSAEEENP